MEETVQHVPNAASEAEASASHTLTFITTEGECIVFEGMDVPVEQAAMWMDEEALTRSGGDVKRLPTSCVMASLLQE